MSLKIPSKKNKVGDCVPEPRASSLSKRREKNLKPRTFFRRKTRARKSWSRPNDNIFGNTIRRHGTVLHWLSTGIQSISKSTGFSCCQRSTRVEEIHIEPRPLQKPKRPTNLFPTAASRENFSLCPTDLSQNQVPPHAVEERKDFETDRKNHEDQETPRTGEKELEEQENPCIDNKRQREEQIPDVEDKGREEHNSNQDNKKQGKEQSRSHENTNQEEDQILCFQNKNKLQEEDPCDDEDEVFDIDSEYSDGPDEPFRPNVPFPASDRNRQRYGNYLVVERIVKGTLLESFMGAMDFLADEIDQRNENMCRGLVHSMISRSLEASEKRTAQSRAVVAVNTRRPAEPVRMDDPVTQVLIVAFFLCHYRMKLYSHIWEEEF